MAKIKFNTAIRVGDLKSGIAVDEMEFVGFSINCQPHHDGQGRYIPRVTVSLMLQHMPSHWTHNVVAIDTHPASVNWADRSDRPKLLNGIDRMSTAGSDKWEQIKAAIEGFEKTILTLLADQLPPGTISD